MPFPHTKPLATYLRNDKRCCINGQSFAYEIKITGKLKSDMPHFIHLWKLSGKWNKFKHLGVSI